jgi:transcriptional regulator with XRE-family HTH domain
MDTFGSKIAEARKKKGLSQKDLAERVKKEDGGSISPQYLNDIEHDRRDPPSDFIIKGLARILDLSEDYLFALSRRLPDDLAKRVAAAHPKQVEEAFRSFRKKMSG